MKIESFTNKLEKLTVNFNENYFEIRDLLVHQMEADNLNFIKDTEFLPILAKFRESLPFFCAMKEKRLYDLTDQELRELYLCYFQINNIQGMNDINLILRQKNSNICSEVKNLKSEKIDSAINSDFFSIKISKNRKSSSYNLRKLTKIEKIIASIFEENVPKAIDVFLVDLPMIYIRNSVSNAIFVGTKIFDLTDLLLGTALNVLIDSNYKSFSLKSKEFLNIYEFLKSGYTNWFFNKNWRKFDLDFAHNITSIYAKDEAYNFHDIYNHWDEFEKYHLYYYPEILAYSFFDYLENRFGQEVVLKLMISFKDFKYVKSISQYFEAFLGYSFGLVIEDWGRYVKDVSYEDFSGKAELAKNNNGNLSVKIDLNYDAKFFLIDENEKIYSIDIFQEKDFYEIDLHLMFKKQIRNKTLLIVKTDEIHKVALNEI